MPSITQSHRDLSTLRPSDVPAYLSGIELYYAGFGLDECVTDKQRRQWRLALETEVNAACENDPYAEGGSRDQPGWSESQPCIQ